MRQSAENSILRPARIRPGDTIGIAAPSGPFTPDAIQSGIEFLESAGFCVKIPDGLYRRAGHLAGDDMHRAQMLNNLFEDPEIKGIVCARGGYGALRILNLLDQSLIRQNPKIFAGFSDISVLHVFFQKNCHLVTFHGPVLTTLGDATPDTRSAFLAAICDDKPVELRADDGMVICPGRAEGRVAGGNLASLCHMLGTPWMACWDRCILILEDVSEPAYKIDRMLTQMKLAGCFDRLAGLVFGTFENCGNMDVVTDILQSIFHDVSFPVLAGFPVGHGHRNLTFPSGMEAVLESFPPGLRFCQTATSFPANI